MAATIIGLSTALPGSFINGDTFVNHAKKFSCKNEKQERVLEELYRRTSITRRCSILPFEEGADTAQQLYELPASELDVGPGTRSRMERYETESLPLALAAAAKALEDAQIEATQVTHLVTISCTGFFAPGFDIQLINTLPLRRTVERTHVGYMGCHGALNGLRVAKMIVEADPSAIVLLCTMELCSLHFQYGWKTDHLVANSLFADGAAALVISADGTVASPDGIMTGGTSNGWQVAATGSYVVPDTTDAMRWKIGDNGFQMHLSSQVPNMIEQVLPEYLRTWLMKNGTSIDQIEHWAVHPGGPRILDAVENCLGLSSQALSPSRAILAECGNMSSPTVLFILQRLRTLDLVGTTVVLGFGPGLTIEATLLTA